MGKVFLKAVLCAIGGVLGWLVTEPMMPGTVGDPTWAQHERMMVFVAVSLIGLASGVFSGLQKGSQRQMWIQMGLGVLLGAVGGLFGHTFSALFTAAIFGTNVFTSHAPLPVLISARTMLGSLFGLFLGAALGAPSFTRRGFMAGVIGGFVGGMAAGALFDTVSLLLAPLLTIGSGRNEVGGPGRAALFLLLGFFVGLFTALVDMLTRHAWVRLVVGKNEGKEWPLDSQITTFGRDERALVPLFGDPNVAPLHASIVRQGKDYVLHDAGTALGVGHNGVRLSQPLVLNPGDAFQIGSHQLQFLMRGYGAQRGPEGRFAGVPITAGGAMRAPVQSSPQPVPAAAPAPLTLVATTGPLTGTRFPIQGAVELGRESTGINLGFDSQVSRRHASIAVGPTGLTLQDLGSTNGTLVNGQRVASATLVRGDTLQVGLTSFRVE